MFSLGIGYLIFYHSLGFELCVGVAGETAAGTYLLLFLNYLLLAVCFFNLKKKTCTFFKE